MIIVNSLAFIIMGNVEKSILEIILPEGMFEWFDIVKGSKMKILRKPERRKKDII